MNNAAIGWNAVDIRTVRDINIFDGQGIKDFSGGSPADSVGQVVVANEEEDGDAVGSQAVVMRLANSRCWVWLGSRLL